MKGTILFFVSILVHTSNSLWTCSTNEQCADVIGSVCIDASCNCSPGQQIVFGGTACSDLAPYHASPCVEDHQCSRLFNSFKCRRYNETEVEGVCSCLPGYHYFIGRCWKTVDIGEQCTTDEECMSIIRDPYSLKCDGTCQCADGYYLRQRGECRQIGFAVGDGCVVNEDCQFDGGVCQPSTFTCINSAASPSTVQRNTTMKMETKTTGIRAHFTSCSMMSPCPDPFICSHHGSCICPMGYYNSDDGLRCLAELGSPSTPAQCDGLLAEVRSGVCMCPPNFFYEDDMRNCVKVARNRNDACVSDSTCQTFGSAARCGEPDTDLWGARSCECIPDLAVWDESRQICRLFAAIGEICEVNSDCLAGELEITCEIGGDGIGHCACPEGLVEFEGLCLTTGLDLGDACQATQECTETVNTVCANGVCSCGNGYQEFDGYCAPIIGGTCTIDTDCVIDDTICDNGTNTCQCDTNFVAYDEQCWPTTSGFESECNVTAQCVSSLGDDSSCTDGLCVCHSGFHFRDGGCWPITRLYAGCRTTSQCYLNGLSERVECRNSLCQCHFDYEYSEQHNTCLSRSSAASITGGIISMVMSLILYIR